MFYQIHCTMSTYITENNVMICHWAVACCVLSTLNILNLKLSLMPQSIIIPCVCKKISYFLYLRQKKTFVSLLLNKQTYQQLLKYKHFWKISIFHQSRFMILITYFKNIHFRYVGYVFLFLLNSWNICMWMLYTSMDVCASVLYWFVFLFGVKTLFCWDTSNQFIKKSDICISYQHNTNFHFLHYGELGQTLLSPVC